jgi:hypothetical protein
MTTEAYEELILDGLKGLPPAALGEITDFIYFVRKRVLQPQAFADEMHALGLRSELKQLSRDEEDHLEKEFAGYERLHPNQ